MNDLNLPKWQLIALPAVVIMLGIFYFSKYFVADELIDANSHVKTLQKELQTALERLEQESARSTVAEREADVVRRANTLLRISERKRQDEIAGLQADLEFYRRIGGANGSQGPLAVHYIELQPTQSDRVYRVIFTLTQKLRWATVISGQVQLSVDGIEDGIARHPTDEQLLAESAGPLGFQFKYFQQLEHLITLPEGFEANQLTIRLRSKSLGAPVEKSMQWDSLFNRAIPTADAEQPVNLLPEH